MNLCTKLLIFVGNGDFGEISIIGDENEILTQEETVLDSVIALFAVNYIFTSHIPALTHSFYVFYRNIL